MRKNATKQNNVNHCFTIRFGIVSTLLPTAVSWKSSKVDAELITLVLSIYTDRLLLIVVVILIVAVVSL